MLLLLKIIRSDQLHPLCPISQTVYQSKCMLSPPCGYAVDAR